MRFDSPLRLFRDHLVREQGRFVLQPRRSVTLPNVSQADLYVHVPFCRHLCPYCPYNRVRHQPALADAYVDAMLGEIDAYREALGPIEIGSIYFGGGTPTTILEDLGRIIDYVDRHFDRRGAIALETIPSDIDARSLATLADVGVRQLSIGVQSFDDRFLELIGRSYDASTLKPAIQAALGAGFASVNLDLMFALPGQTIDEAVADLETAIGLGADQVTLYPLFTFPYSSVGRHLRIRQVRFPSLPVRRRMYRALHTTALAHGMRRVSVWSFARGDAPPFSSVTRERFLGVGAGAATYLPGLFYFNTFSIPDYIRSCSTGSLPVALVMAMSPLMEAWYWFYWRLYETRVSKRLLDRRFADNADPRRLLRLARLFGLVRDDGDSWCMTERGAFWIHLLQNHYVLRDINAVWTEAMRNPWPGQVAL